MVTNSININKTNRYLS